MYIPFRALIEALQMRRYHEKFLFYLLKLHILRLRLLLASTLTCVGVALSLLCLLLSVDVL
jgi:hypothetical protein